MNQDIGEVLHEAARTGSKAELDELLAGIQQQIQALSSSSESVLTHEINRRNEKRYTPLHTAIFARYFCSAHVGL
jgi:hypothetical protein